MSLFTDLSAFQSTPVAQPINQLNQADIDQLFAFIDCLLISMGFSSLIIGFFIGLYFQRRYDIWLCFKRGGDYCPLCHQDKGQEGNQCLDCGGSGVCSTCSDDSYVGDHCSRCRDSFECPSCQGGNQ
jgi:hypothetical protein